MPQSKNVSDFFMSQKQKVLNEGLVSKMITDLYSKNIYRLPLSKSAITEYGSKNFSPAHSGNLSNSIDFYTRVGTPVLAAADGLVVNLRKDSAERGNTTEFWDKGNFLNILHANRESTWYEHLETGGVVVEVGDKVLKGELVAYSGNTGFSEKPHLHFQVNAYFGPGMKNYVTRKARFEDLKDFYREE